MVFAIVSCLLFLVANIRCANADIAADGLAMAALAEAFPRLTTLIGRNLLPTETVWIKPEVETTGGIPYWCSYYGVKCNSDNAVIDVNLESFQMEGYLPDQIGNLNSLTSFTVGYNYVFGTIPSSIGSWTQISYMNFFGNFLTGTIPSVISSLKTLTDLELDQNYLNGTIPSFLFELTKLKVLHLYDNSFSGTIPSNIGDLQMLTRLTLDTNGLRGTIPESIATMRRLQYLHLFNNQLEGTIPNSISALTELYDISIYDNYFTGTLPYLADLTDLFILDVHTNFLTMGGLSELPESDFSWLTIQGPMDLSGNCLTLPVKGFVATGCKPTVAPTSAPSTLAPSGPSYQPTQMPTAPTYQPTNMPTAPTYQPTQMPTHSIQPSSMPTWTPEIVTTILSQDFYFTGVPANFSEYDMDYWTFVDATDVIVSTALGLTPMDKYKFNSMTPSAYPLAFADKLVDTLQVDMTLIFTIISKSGATSNDTRMAAMDAITNGAYDKPIEDANFPFGVATTGTPYMLANTNTKSSPSKAPTRPFMNVSDSPFWSLIALMLVPILGCMFLCYRGYRFKKPEDKFANTKDEAPAVVDPDAAYSYP